MGKINSNDFIITAALTTDGTQETIAHATSASLEYSNAVIEVTTKDNDSSAEFIPGRTSYTISVDGLMDYSGSDSNTLNTVELFDAVQAGTKVEWAMSGDDRTGVGKVTYDGEAYITSFSQSGGSDDTATYSLSLQGTGTIAKTVAT